MRSGGWGGCYEGLQRGGGLAGVKSDMQLISLSRRPVSLHCGGWNRGLPVLNSCRSKAASLPFLDMWMEGGREREREGVKK